MQVAGEGEEIRVQLDSVQQQYGFILLTDDHKEYWAEIMMPIPKGSESTKHEPPSGQSQP